MSAAVLEDLLESPSPRRRPDGPAPSPARTRPPRRGPGVGPVARPRRLRFVAPPPRARACHDESVGATPVRARSWRLTDRGLTLVLMVGAALVVASVVVVGLTALRVTGESYRPAPGVAAPATIER